jgi:hypothetical protein
MTPQEFHEACHDAICECPQFRPYDDDQEIQGYGEFGKIPKRGWVKLIKFWKDEPLLWESGYEEALPEEVQELFEKVDSLFEKAIKETFT